LIIIYKKVIDCSNVYGGLVFNNLPKTKLYIAILRESQGDWHLYGKGDTQFLR
jgi:hypothetical protein